MRCQTYKCLFLDSKLLAQKAMTSRTFYRSVLIQIFREIVDPYIAIAPMPILPMRIAQSAHLLWLLDRSLAIDIENAHLL